MHRQLFSRRAKDRIVRTANRILQAKLVGVAVALAGTVTLIFDLIVNRTASLVVCAAMTAAGVLVWLIPGLRRR